MKLSYLSESTKCGLLSYSTYITLTNINIQSQWKSAEAGLDLGPSKQKDYGADSLIIMLSSLIITQHKKACGGSNTQKNV